MLFENSSVAYSTDGKTLAISNTSSQDPTLIEIYDLPSGTHTGSYRAPGGRIVVQIWTHGEYLRFVTVEPESITVWEVAFTSAHTPAMVESFRTPNKIGDAKDEKFLFLHSLSQLASTVQDTLFVWDAQNSRFLLESAPVSTSYSSGLHGMSFSLDGRFFSHTASSQEIYVWKRSPASYTLHQKLAFPSGPLKPLLSPNGESIIAAGHSTIHLWHTRDQIISLPSFPVRKSEWEFTLGFSPSEELAAYTGVGENTITIFDLQSGNLRLGIDVGMEVRCLRVAGGTVAVAGEGKVITWSLPAEDCVDARASIKNGIHTTTLDFAGLAFPNEKSISPDLSRIAVVEYGSSFSMQIHDTSTGKRLAVTKISDSLERVILDGSEVWCMDWGNSVEGWKIVEDTESGITKLAPLEATACPPRVFPWQSRGGYEITHDGWVLSPTRKRLVWLPHYWRSSEVSRTWSGSGRFLGLVHGGLPDVVILEFPE